MKRIASLLLGFSLLLIAAPQAEAAPGISTYTQKVLERADKGVAYALTGNAATDFAIYYFSWVRSVGSTIVALLDTKLRVVETKRDLLEHTACLSADLFLLQSKIEEVRQKLKEAIDQKNIIAITRLESLVEWLNERIDILLQGSKDPTMKDESWNERRLFDEDKPQKEMLCPYDADYSPPSVAGYGCDTETMSEALTAISGVTGSAALSSATTAEKAGLETVIARIQQFISEAQSYLSLQQEIDKLLGRSSQLPASLPPRTHKAAEGCMAEVPEGAISWALRGDFSIENDENAILKAFQEQRREEGDERPLPDPFGVFDENAANDSDSSSSSSSSASNVFQWMFEYVGSQIFRTLAINQGEKETNAFAVGSDPALALEDAMKPLTSAVKRLSHLAFDINKNDKGLRDFVRDYAYFLRRSCIYRPCNARLDQVLKIIFEDKCFPYTNGDYKETDSDYEECKRAAKVNVSP
jgi:hypothetical protein